VFIKLKHLRRLEENTISQYALIGDLVFVDSSQSNSDISTLKRIDSHALTALVVSVDSEFWFPTFASPSSEVVLAHVKAWFELLKS